jgi:hypothetical protein
MDVAAGGGSGGDGGEESGPSVEAMDSRDGTGGSGGGGATAAGPSMATATNVGGPTRKRRAASIFLGEVPNNDIDPTADTPSSSSVHTKNKARKK